LNDFPLKHAMPFSLDQRTATGLFLGLMTVLIVSFSPGLFYKGAFVLTAVILACYEFFRFKFPKIPFFVQGIFACFYIVMPCFVIFLLMQNAKFFYCVLSMVCLGDTAAYVCGKRFGKKKLAPTVSPHKTYAGSIAHMITALCVACAFKFFGFLENCGWLFSLILAVCVSVCGQLGDLFESFLKRKAGIKDSGNLLPGHGGILDRIDASLFALPAAFFLYFLHF